MEATEDIAQGAGDKKVLLDEAEFLAGLGLVIRVKDLGDGFAAGFFGECLAVTAAVEGLEIDFFRGARFPQPEEVDGVGAVAGDGDVVRDADDFLGIDPAGDVVAFVVEDVFDVAVELDRLGIFGPDDFPRRAEAHPVVGQFDLVAVAEFLAEKAELIMDAVANGGVIEGGEGIEEAGGETAETAVAEAHVVFLATDFFDVVAEFLERLLGLLIDASVIKAVGKEPAHEKFEREVVDAADVLLIVDGLGGDHALDDALLHRLGGGQPPVAFGRRMDIVSEAEFEMMQNRILHRLGGFLEKAGEFGVGGHGRNEG